MAVKRILVIDDDDHIREIIQACLRDLGGWDVWEANSGRAGLAIAATQKPNAILLDWIMPDMDGQSVLLALRADPELQSIPVILLSVNTPWFQPGDYQRWGIQGAIAKPFNAVELPGQIAAILGWSDI